MKKIQFLLLTAIINLSAFAQTDTMPYQLDVNGLYPFKIYTDTQMRSALGEPTRVDINYLGTNYETRWYMYNYGNDPYDHDSFSHEVEYGGLTGFTIDSSRFKIFGGRVKVGDSLSLLTQLGFTLHADEHNINKSYIQWGDGKIIFTKDSTNIITQIHFWFPLN